MKAKEEIERAGLKFSIQETKIMTSGLITSWQIEEGKWKQRQILFSWAPKLLWMMTVAMKLILLLLGKKGKPRQCLWQT